MLTFREDGFTIDVHTGPMPHEDWISCVRDMIELFQSLDHNMVSGRDFYFALKLLKEMLPDEKMARMMEPKS